MIVGQLNNLLKKATTVNGCFFLITILLLSVLGLAGFTPSHIKEKSAPYKLYLVQQNKRTLCSNLSNIELYNTPFTFELITPDSQFELFVKPTLNKSLFEKSVSGYSLEKLGCFEAGMGMAEALKNPDKEFMLSKTGFHYWYHEHDTDSRFSSVIKTDSGFLATQIIEQWFDADKQQKSFPLSHLNKPLYFIISYQLPGNEENLLLQRFNIAIRWKN